MSWVLKVCQCFIVRMRPHKQHSTYIAHLLLLDYFRLYSTEYKYG